MMKTIVKMSVLGALLLALAVPQMSFADPVSGCTNGQNSSVDYGPDNGGIVVYTDFVCSLYPSASSYTIDLTQNLTYDNADYYTNILGPGYIVVINGNPNTLSDDSSGLWNQSLWAAVLFWPGDQDAGTASDSLIVYYAGNSGFPTVGDVRTLDDYVSAYYYGGIPDSEFGPPYSDFFVQSGDPAVYAPGNDVYNVYPTPEPSSLFLLGTGLLGLAIVVFRKAKSSGLVLHS
jgi:PEP-CTERM motif